MNRYPGIRPFTSAESPLFYGRTDDTERLLRLIRLEKLVILYGKSGYGKSSLLRAGIYPRLIAAGDAPFREIRLGPYKPGESTPPAQARRNAALPDAAPKAALDTLFPADDALWLALKRRQLAAEPPAPGDAADPAVHHPPSDRFLLFFDQFEELFTYPPDQILEFKKQLAEALYTLVPDRYGRALAKNPDALTPAARAAFFAPLDLKVVFSIRADRMSLLNGLKDQLPNLLQHTYELDALTEAQARAAVVLPAGLLPSAKLTPSPTPKGRGDSTTTTPLRPDLLPSSPLHLPSPEGEGLGVGLTAFDTPPFTYAPETLAAIFAALQDERGRIETSTLQIVCKHVEDNVVGKRLTVDGERLTVDGTRLTEEGSGWTVDGEPEIVVEAADLGDIKGIFRNFYENTLAGLPDAERAAARRLVEDVLVSPEGVRLPFAAPALAGMGYAPEMLDALARASLLRVERDDQGRMIYEVGHDTLVAPIHEAAKARREQETKKRLQREADEQRREKEKAVAARRRARLVALGAVVLSLFALAASLWAWRQTRIAQEQTRIAEEKTVLAEQNQRKADVKTVEAEQNLKKAEESARIAEEKRLEVEQQKNATAEQKRIAEEEARRARQALLDVEKATVQVVQSLLDNASAAIYRLDYETARDRLHDAAGLTSKKPFDNPLGRLRPVVADSLMELAWFYTETDNTLAALFEISVLAQVLARPNPADALHDKTVAAKTEEAIRTLRAAVRDTLRQMRPLAFQAMEARYYPVLLPVPGGTFYPGENYQVGLSDFRLARTETTVWQYNLYLVARGKDIFDDKTISRPGWGWEGDNPIVNVSWFDACLYANWLSRRFGLREAYAMGEMTKGRYGDYYTDITLDTAANGFRLPTEAEWEFAARGGAAGLRDSFAYAGSNQLDRVGWYDENSGNRARPVAQKLPNQLGLYDMSGNVWEWCWDWYGNDYPDTLAMNPVGPSSGDARVVRGGSWNGNTRNVRVSFRNYDDPDERYFVVGFRAAQDK